MKELYIKLYIIVIFFCSALLNSTGAIAQYKSFQLTKAGDTINRVDQKGFKQGKWVIVVPEFKGEEGYREEGSYKDDKREGEWRRYNNLKNVIAIENYMYGGLDGTSQYFDRLGNLIREENWKGYNPEAPYDTIAVYGEGNDEIKEFKIVKAEQYSVKHGTWKFYEGSTGKLLSTEKYDRGAPLKDTPQTAEEGEIDEKVKAKMTPKEVIEYEKKRHHRQLPKNKEAVRVLKSIS
jgi:antitoxin component YwqK of YwqJK toxin-antitoxin module